MKKLFILGAIALFASSCATHRAGVINTTVQPRVEATTKVVNLDIAEKPFTYNYIPTDQDGKNLSQDQLLNNAIYMALKAYGNADVMVNVNHYITIKKGLFGQRVSSIEITGYPAKYINFRQPTEEDYKNITTLRPFSSIVKEATESRPGLGRLFGIKK